MICFCPFVDELTKRGRKILRVYICMFCFLVYTKREEEFDEFISLFMHICLYLCTLLNIFIVICYAWVKGELLWSLSLIHAYITPWVLSSSKRERLLAQRLVTLVLMMINSCTYNTNNLVFIKFQIFNQDLSRCLASTKNLKSSFEAITYVDSRTHASRSHQVLKEDMD